MMCAKVSLGGIGRTIFVNDALSDGWHVSVIPADRPYAQDLWFARRDCALAFANGMAAAVTAWRVIDKSTSRSDEVDRAKAESFAQLDLFITESRDP